MKKILSDIYRNFVLYFQIYMLLLLIPLTYNFIPVNEGTKTFYISSSNIDDVIHTLKTNGYEVTWLDKLMLKLRKTPDEGWYSVEPSEYGRILFFQHLYQQKTDEIMDIVVYAGETKEELIARLANDMKLDQDKLLQIYDTLAHFKEADILAQRYTLARKADENTTMQYIFYKSRQTLNTFVKEYFTTTPERLELKIIHIIASIIQKESNSIEEMPLISSVIYNRLEKGMRLQMDGTLNYGPYAHTVVTPERIKSDESEYNTYKHKGLPPHPLSTVTLDALQASMKPKKSDYIFFMLNENGTHNFTVTYDEHLDNIRAFRKYQKEREKEKETEFKASL
ncbi:endolytic transglycosylase MltG [Sulfurovum sp. XTW-4]|uniref:Endolytic murein transglycosylase n=1 Tax=Sulfurovum xiamenensis TaxID=3019066 RepID=A0ABT7QQD1_9BACT|nr:endolytic transglycosylase MltG [Sulfurovum xiamenensis]MDM5263305.1 endolytic transglycosylase MltG [Sulfurovum xiamenensis]